MRDEVYDAVRALGAAKVIALFSGGNDEGGYDEFVFQDAEGNELSGEPWESFVRHGGIDNEHFEVVELALDAVLDGRYGGFAFPGYVDGEVVVDAVARTAVVKGGEQTYVADSFEESL